MSLSSLDFRVLSVIPLSFPRSVKRLGEFCSVQQSLADAAINLTNEAASPNVKSALGREKLDQLHTLLGHVKVEAERGSIEAEWINAQLNNQTEKTEQQNGAMINAAGNKKSNKVPN